MQLWRIGARRKPVSARGSSPLKCDGKRSETACSPETRFLARFGTAGWALAFWWMGVAGVALLLALTSQPAKAELHFRGDIGVALQNDLTYRASDRDAKINDLYFTIEPSFSLEFTEGFSLEAAFVLEPVFDPDPNQNRWFDDHGLFVEQLFLNYAWNRYSVRAGKLNPAFGLAWNLAPGIYGADFAEDYELTERIGVGASIELGDGTFGRHTLSADTFFLDKSFLSESTLNNRGHTRERDGGVSNTGDLRSFAVSLQGTEIPQLSGLTYHLGFEQQHGGHGERNERGYVAGLTYGFSPMDEVEIELLSEFVYKHFADGIDSNRIYFTQSALASWKGWYAALSYTKRDTHSRVDRDFNDSLFQTSVGYEFPIGLGVHFAWRYAREDGMKVDGVGVQFTYAYAFEF